MHCPLRCTPTSRDLARRCRASELEREQNPKRKLILLPRARHARSSSALRCPEPLRVAAAAARGDLPECGGKRSQRKSKHPGRRRSTQHGHSRAGSRLGIRWGWVGVETRGHARFQFAGRFAQLGGNFAQKFRAAPLGFRRDFLFDVAAQASQLFIDALAKLFKFVHRRVRRTGRGDSGIIGTPRECRKEESWRFPINGSTASNAGRPRYKVFSAAATSRRAPNFAPTAAPCRASTARVTIT